jgi:DNA-binding NarL/FixJ family response regulator
MKHIKVLLAEDHMIVRQGLRSLLEAEGDMEIVCEAETGREAVRLARQFLPDVILIDVAMPLLNGLLASRQILEILPSSRILILSAHEDEAYLEHAMETGVAGYLVKQTSAHILAHAVRTVAAGKPYFSPSLTKRLPQYEISKDGTKVRKLAASRLTPRESEVLQLVAEGLANRQTAEELGISVKTVEKHRQAIMDKLHVHDTAGLTRYAIAAGIIESSVQKTTG